MCVCVGGGGGVGEGLAREKKGTVTFFLLGVCTVLPLKMLPERVELACDRMGHQAPFCFCFLFLVIYFELGVLVFF